MLPSDLLVARSRGKFVYPLFSKFRLEEEYISHMLIDAFLESLNRERGRLLKKIQEIEDQAYRLGLDYRFTRGLAHLLWRGTTLEPPVDPSTSTRVRLEVFREAAKRYGGFVLDGAEREDVQKSVAERLGLEPEDVERAMRAVYEDEWMVKGFEYIEPVELLREYNLSLAQTMLFRASRIDVILGATGTKAKIILYNLKRLGLMYMAYRHGKAIRLEIDGPASILKQTERYGTRMAKLLPHIMAADSWSLKAYVSWRGRRKIFELKSSSGKLFPRKEIGLESFDSSVEENFYGSFIKLNTSWKILREPEPLVAGHSILIPDFSFEKDGTRVYLEIMGFWTEDYLRRKVDKLKKLGRTNFIVAVQEELACSPLMGELPQTVVVYRRQLKASTIYRILLRISPERRGLARKTVPKVPQEVREFLSRVKRAKLSEVIQALSKYGFGEEDSILILESLGFRIEWTSLDPSKVIVRRGDLS